MSLQHIQKNSPRLLPKPAKFEKNPPNGYRVIRKTKCGAGGAGGASGAGGAGGAGSSPIHKQASLVGRLISKLDIVSRLSVSPDRTWLKRDTKSIMVDTNIPLWGGSLSVYGSNLYGH